jgi:hypothetical protein
LKSLPYPGFLWPALLAALLLVAAPSLAAASPPGFPAAQTRGAFDLVVLHGNTGDPIAGAQVRYEREPGVFIEARTDSRGRLRLRSPEVPARVEVSHGGRSRVVEIAPGREERLEVELLAALALEVRLVDASGRSVPGWPVRLVGREGDAAPGSQGRVFTVDTDAGGLALFSDPKGELRGSELREWSWTVELDVVAAEPVSQPVDLLGAPAGRHRLRLPALGALELQVTTSDGGVPEPGRVRLLPAGLGHVDAPQATLDAEGRVRFDRLGVGLLFDPVFEGPAGEQRGPRLEGPAGQGRTARHQWTLPGPPPSLELRIRLAGADADQPAADLVEGSAVVVRAAWQGGAHSWPEFQVGAEGRLSLDFPVAARDAAFGLLEVEHSPAGRRRRLGEVNLGALGSGPLASAEVVLLELPPAARGRIFGRDDLPVAGARVHAARWPGSDGAEPPRLHASSDANGQFDLALPPSARPLGGRLALRVEAPGYLSRDAEVDFGAEGLRLQLDPAVPLSGSLRLQGPAPEQLLVRAQTPDGRSFETPLLPAPEGDGSGAARPFAFPGLPAGPLALWLHRVGFGDVLEVGALELSQGPATVLETMDVRGFLAGYPLEVHLPAGSADRYFVRAQGQARWGEFSGPRAQVWSRRGSIDVELAAPGAITQSLRVGPGGEVVRLEPAIEVELTSALGFDAASLAHGLGLRLLPAAGQTQRGPAPLVPMPALGDVRRVAVEFLGEAQVEWEFSAGELRPPVRWRGPRVRLDGARVELKVAPEAGPLADALRRFEGGQR